MREGGGGEAEAGFGPEFRYVLLKLGREGQEMESGFGVGDGSSVGNAMKVTCKMDPPVMAAEKWKHMSCFLSRSPNDKKES